MTRGGRRPPPVPPRPSKEAVAEALAARRTLLRPVPPAPTKEMASLRGLPPLPKSLSGVMDVEGLRLLEAGMQGPSSARFGGAQEAALPAGRSRKQSNLDAQLALLRQEMVGLRQLDLSLLSQLWSLNESIHEFRVLLQDDAPLSPPSPSSGDEDDEEFFQVAAPRQQQSRPKRHRAPPEGLKASKKALPFRLPPHRPNEDDDDEDPKQRRYSSASSPSSSTRSSFEFGEV